MKKMKTQQMKIYKMSINTEDDRDRRIQKMKT